VASSIKMPRTGAHILAGVAPNGVDHQELREGGSRPRAQPGRGCEGLIEKAIEYARYLPGNALLGEACSLT